MPTTTKKIVAQDTLSFISSLSEMNTHLSEEHIVYAKAVIKNLKKAFKEAPSEVNVNIIGDRKLSADTITHINAAIEHLKKASVIESNLTITI